LIHSKRVEKKAPHSTFINTKSPKAISKVLRCEEIKHLKSIIMLIVTGLATCLSRRLQCYCQLQHSRQVSGEYAKRASNPNPRTPTKHYPSNM